MSAYFPPEIGSAAHLFHDLGAELVQRGHQVTVLTGFPAYNIDEKSLPEKYKKGKFFVEEIHGMNVMRIRSPRMPRHIPVLRGMEQIIMAWNFSFKGIGKTSKNDILLIYSPPLFLALSAFIIRWFKGCKVIVNIQDLFPQSAIDLGVLRNRILISLFRKIESTVYRRSNVITVHSKGNLKHVIKCGGDEHTALEVPNLVDTKSIQPGERNNNFRRKNNIPESEFLVSFAGVIGLSQDIDTIIESAMLTKNLSGIVYYIVGDGIEKERLVKKAEGMSNIVFLPMISKEEYVELLHASDICLTTLHQEVKTPVVPSKILSIMAAGRPVLASMPSGGDAPKLIQEAQCGITIGPNDPKEFAEKIRWMYTHPEECITMGKNGRAYAVDHLSLEACTTLYEQLFKKLIQ